MPVTNTRLPYLLDTYQSREAHDPGWLYSTNHGYGQICIGKRIRRVHAYVCELTHGPAPTGLIARHLCTDNRACFWAEHLVWGTRRQNRLDSVADAFYREPPTLRYSDVSPQDVQRIRMLRASGTTLAALGRAWDISVSDVRFLLHPTPEPPPAHEPRPEPDPDAWMLQPPPEWLRA
jgi:hypothetical protein